MEPSPYRLAAPPSSRGRRCPRCRDSATRLVTRWLADLEVEECPECHGQWLGHKLFGQVVMDPALQRAVIERARLARFTVVDDGGLACPACRGTMTRKEFAGSSGIYIDICARHGVWLDDGELHQIIEHLGSGADDLTIGTRDEPPAALVPALSAADLELPRPELPDGPTRDHPDYKGLVIQALVFIGYVALRLWLGR